MLRALSAILISALLSTSVTGAGALEVQQYPAAVPPPSVIESCTWRAADRIRMRDLQNADAGEVGRCVQTQGELDGYVLRYARRTHGNFSNEEYLIYVQFADDALRQSFLQDPRRVRVLGVFGYDGAPFLLVTETR